MRDTSGEEIGTVDELTGDENHDIFDGLTISGGAFGAKKYVPSEHVQEIREGVVVLDVAAASLEDFEEPAREEQILSEGSTWYQRLASRLFGR